MVRRSAAAVAVWMAVLGLARCSTEDACDDVKYPAATGATLHVSAACGSASGTGSRAAPFARIGAALTAAKAGTTVLVAAGTYPESLQLPAGVNVAGVGSGQVVVQPAAGVGVTATAGGASEIRGLSVRGARKAGILAAGTSLALVDVEVAQTVAEGGKHGHGLQVTDAATLVLQSSQILDNAGTGVLVQGVGLISVVDPIWAPAPAAADGATSVVDPIWAPSSVIAGNKGGGIAVVDPIWSPAKTDRTGAEAGAVTIVATDIRGNTGFGLALYGAGATLERTAVRDTVSSATGDFADGVVLAASQRQVTPALVIDAGTVISGSGRAGLLVATASAVKVSAMLADNALGGVWAQGGGTEVTLDAKARLRANSLVGAAATAGALLTIDGSRIEGTKARPYASPAGGQPQDVGDGVGVFAKARAKINKAVIAGSARAGLVVHDAAADANGQVDVQVSGNQFTGGQFGIVVNVGGAKADGPALESGNQFSAVAKSVDPAGNLKVRTSACEGDNCAPAPVVAP